MEAVNIKPKVSVIVPVYNAASTLARSARSVTEQTMPFFELLLIDNNSQDGSFALAESLAGEDARIRVLREYRQGVSAARNRGLDEAAGEFVFFLDSDDAIYPDALELMLRETEHSTSDAVFCGIENVGHRENVKYRKREESVQEHEAFRDTARGATEIARLFAQHLHEYGMYRVFALYRRDALGTLRFDEKLSLGEDLQFNLEFFTRCGGVTMLSAPLYQYTLPLLGAGSLASKYRPDMTAIKSGRITRVREFVCANGAWNARTEHEFNIMLTSEAFSCAANLFSAPKSEWSGEFGCLLAQPWIGELRRYRYKNTLSVGRGLFVMALKARSLTGVLSAVKLYKLLGN
jgi:glycosyltransferase involved in cell wall biosynthesis